MCKYMGFSMCSTEPSALVVEGTEEGGDVRMLQEAVAEAEECVHVLAKQKVCISVASVAWPSVFFSMCTHSDRNGRAYAKAC
jgi:hypothetical protein